MSRTDGAERQKTGQTLTRAGGRAGRLWIAPPLRAESDGSQQNGHHRAQQPQGQKDPRPMGQGAKEKGQHGASQSDQRCFYHDPARLRLGVGLSVPHDQLISHDAAHQAKQEHQPHAVPHHAEQQEADGGGQGQKNFVHSIHIHMEILSQTRIKESCIL